MPWKSVAEVWVVTTDTGPFSDDLFYVLLATDRRGQVIADSSAGPEFVGRLQALPGFDNRAFTEAMTSTRNACFLCWRARTQPGV